MSRIAHVMYVPAREKQMLSRSSLEQGLQMTIEPADLARVRRHTHN